MAYDQWMINFEEAVQNRLNNALQASWLYISIRPAPETSTKVPMETNYVKMLSSSCFISPLLLTHLQFDSALSLGKQIAALLQHISFETGEKTKAILIEKLKLVLMKNKALHFVEKIELGTTSFVYIISVSNPTSYNLVNIRPGEKNMSLNPNPSRFL